MSSGEGVDGEANRPFQIFFTQDWSSGDCSGEERLTSLMKLKGKCLGAIWRIIWRLMTSRSPLLGCSFWQMLGQGFSDLQSQGATIKGKARPQPTESIRCPAYHVPAWTPHQWLQAAALKKVIKNIQFFPTKADVVVRKLQG